jgi:scyllo-inositol 2-dehydrogenase (NADP+)
LDAQAPITASVPPRPKTRERIRVAVVGLGWVAINRNLPILSRRNEYELVGVVDRNRERALEVAKRFKCPRSAAADTLADVPWLDEVDLVCVSTGPQAHHQLLREGLLSGKDVLTEKPFAMTVGEGEELVSVAASNRRILGVVHNFQFASSTLKLLGDIERGRLGQIRSIEARQLSNPARELPSWYDELPLGLFYDESPHFLYLLSRIAPGSLDFLRSEAFPSTTGRRTPATVEVKYSCQTSNGSIPVSMGMSFEASISEWHLTVFGDAALGDIDLFRDIYIRLPNDGAHTTRTTFRTTALATRQHWGQHFSRGIAHLRGTLLYGTDEVFARLARALIDRREPEGIGAADALRILKLQHQAIDRVEVL